MVRHDEQRMRADPIADLADADAEHPAHEAMIETRNAPAQRPFEVHREPLHRDQHKAHDGDDSERIDRAQHDPRPRFRRDYGAAPAPLRPPHNSFRGGRPWRSRSLHKAGAPAYYARRPRETPRRLRSRRAAADGRR